jgi:hypothetical protein
MRKFTPTWKTNWSNGFSRYFPALASVIVFAGVGSLLLLASHAATPTGAAELEAGTLSAKAGIVNDSTASGSKAVKFGTGGTSSGPVNGLLTDDPDFFPTGVWLQTPESNAAAYKAIGINMFIGSYNGMTHSNLVSLNSNGITAVADQSSVTLGDALGPTIMKGWLQQDEPDNAQDNGHGGYDPCISPSSLITQYNAFRAGDSLHRPVMLGFGRGVADTGWVGRGTCTGDTQYYVDASPAGDILAFDVYPINSGLPLYYVAKGVSNLLGWSGNSKPVWADIETTDFGDTQGPTPAQTKYEVWSAIIHGATGIDYFAHIFSPTFHEAGLLTDPTMSAAVGAINSQIASLAAVINVGTTVSNSVTSSAGSSVPVDTMTKSYNGSTYIIAAAMRGSATTATYHPVGITSGTATVLGENRTISISGGSFSDNFAGYDVHIYKIN